MSPSPFAVALAVKMARKVFADHGNDTELVATEASLASLLAQAFAAALPGLAGPAPRALLDEEGKKP
jgi:hypothetical protein